MSSTTQQHLANSDNNEASKRCKQVANVGTKKAVGGSKTALETVCSAVILRVRLVRMRIALRLLCDAYSIERVGLHDVH